MKINSKEWWNQEFRVNWCIGINGIDQTRFFMKRILESIKFTKGTTVLDWGCAFGQGVDVLNKNGYLAEGYDFSEIAIKFSKKIYPQYTFMSKIPDKTYDIVISSNCLEHFEEPEEQLKEIMKLSHNLVVIMTPYNQPPCQVHPVTIDECSFPKNVNGFTMVNRLIIPSVNMAFDGGEQIIFIYERDL